MPVLDLARELAAALPRSRADPARRRGHARAAARRHAGRAARRRRAAAGAGVLRGQRARGLPVVADDARPRDRRGVRPAARSAASWSRWPGPRAASGRPRSRCTSAWRRPGWRRAGRSASSTSTSRRATSARCWTRPHRRSVVDLVDVAQRDLRAPPPGDALHAQGRLPAAARARGGRARPRTWTRWSPATCSPRSRRATR